MVKKGIIRRRGGKLVQDIAKDILHPDFLAKHFKDANKEAESFITKISGINRVSKQLEDTYNNTTKAIEEQRKLSEELAESESERLEIERHFGKLLKEEKRANEENLKVVEKARKEVDKLEHSWNKIKLHASYFVKTMQHLPVALAGAAVAKLVVLLKEAYMWWEKYYEQLQLNAIRTREALRDAVGYMPALEKGIMKTATKAHWLGFNMEAVATIVAGMAETGGAAMLEAVGPGGKESERYQQAGMFMARGMGMGEETAGRFIGNVVKMFRWGEKEINSFGLRMAKTAKDFKVSYTGVAKDVARSMDTWVKYGKEWGKVATASAVYTRQFGLELEQVLKIGDKFKTFDEAAANVSKLNAIFGTSLDTMDMLYKNEAERAEEVRKQLISTGNTWENMNKFQREAIVASTGWSDVTAATLLSNKNLDKSYKAINESLAEKEEAEKKAADSETKNRREALQMIKNVSKVLGEFFGVEGKYRLALKKIADTFAPLFKAFRLFQIEILNKLGDAFKKTISEETVAKLTRMFNKIGDFAARMVEKYFPKVLKALEKMVNWLTEEKFEKFVSFVFPKLEAVISSIAKSLDRVAEGDILGAWKELHWTIKAFALFLVGTKMSGAISAVWSLGGALVNLSRYRSLMKALPGASAGAGGGSFAAAGAVGALTQGAAGYGISKTISSKFGAGAGLGAAGGLGALSLLAMNPMTLPLAVGLGVGWWRGTTEKGRKEMFDSLKKTFAPYTEALEKVYDRVKIIATGIWHEWKTNWENIKTGANGIVEIYDFVVEKITEKWENFQQTMTPIWDEFKKGWSEVIDSITGMIGQENMKKMDEFFGTLKGWVDKIYNTVKKLDPVLTPIKGLIELLSPENEMRIYNKQKKIADKISKDVDEKIKIAKGGGVTPLLEEGFSPLLDRYTKQATAKGDVEAMQGVGPMGVGAAVSQYMQEVKIKGVKVVIAPVLLDGRKVGEALVQVSEG